MTTKEEEFLPFPVPRARVPQATFFRSTWLTSSIASLREFGHFERYKELIDPAHAEAILSAVPGVWLPMETAMAHYSACDRLGLSTADMLAMAEGATRRASATSFAFTARVATGAGITPWTIFAQTHRLWAQTCKGGGVAVYKCGPKEARIEIIAFPLARYRYNRVAMRGIIQVAAQLFCTRVYASEAAQTRSPDEVILRVSWV